MKDLLGLRLFTRVARLGSISAAARDCGLSQSQASRIIAEMESGLGVRLLVRTTRAVVLTEAGGEYLVRVEAILDALEEAQNSVRDGGDLRGIVRISMPSSLGYREVIPRLAGFADMHPALDIQVVLVDQRQDLVRDAVDVALRMGKLGDSSATAQLVTSIPRRIIAARSYLERAGTPTSPEELVRHRIIGGPPGATSWTFEREGRALVVDLRPSVSFNDNEGAVVAAISGLGIASTPMRSYRHELLDGSLVELLTTWKRSMVEVHAYYPLGRSTRVAARSLVEYLKAGFERTVLPAY